MRRALVTGGSGAIGATVCRELAAAGHTVFVHAHRHAEAASAVVAARRTPELAYTSTKRAIARWVRTQAPLAAWAGAGIPLNAVGPGLVDTPMTAGLLADSVMRSRLAEQMPMPLGWPAVPTDIAPALDWLSSADNTMITAQTLVVDGGYSL